MSQLKGMAAIRQYINNYSEATVLAWINNEGFPAIKIQPSGIWESDTELIDVWRKNKINGKAVEVARPEIKKVTMHSRRSKK